MDLRYYGLCLVLINLVYCDITSELAVISKKNARSSGLYDTSWPIDHADSSRNKFAVNSGFHFDTNEILPNEKNFKIQTVDLMPFAEWTVTRDQEIFVMTGPRASPRLLKLNATTLEILQTTALKSSLYMGGMAVLQNGHVYCVLSNRLYRFWNGDLHNSTFMDLPRIEGGLEETNGMIIGTNGHIIIKSWTMNPSEISFARGASGLDLFFLQVSAAFGAIGAFGFESFCCSRTKTDRRRAFFGFATGVMISWLLMTLFVFAVLLYVKGPWNPCVVIFGEWRQKFSKISIVDPNSMELVNSVDLTFDRISFARMALASDSQQPGVDNLITLGEEFVIRWKYYHSNHSLVMDDTWTERYRDAEDGSYPGTGPTIWNDIVYFTDNTYPLMTAPMYRMYSKSLRPDTPPPKLLIKNINNQGEPGFMFYSPTIVPFASNTKNDTLDACVLVWDTLGRSIQCRNLETLEIVWQHHAIQSDCITATMHLDAATGRTQTLVYFNDYDVGPTTPHQWMRVTSVDKNVYKNNTKYLVVANGEDGKILARIPLRSGHNVIMPSMIVPGQNRDVFISSRNHFMRVSQF